MTGKGWSWLGTNAYNNKLLAETTAFQKPTPFFFVVHHLCRTNLLFQVGTFEKTFIFYFRTNNCVPPPPPMTHHHQPTSSCAVYTSRYTRSAIMSPTSSSWSYILLFQRCCCTTRRCESKKSQFQGLFFLTKNIARRVPHTHGTTTPSHRHFPPYYDNVKRNTDRNNILA